jgi:hypothetical protein
LVLRIGGPRHVYSSNQTNLLPSSSVRYKALRDKIQFDHPYNKDLADVINVNIKNLFENRAKGMFVIRTDELAINNRARWCNKTDDILGFLLQPWALNRL